MLASSGNFAQGFAYAGRLMGIPIAVVMLNETSPYKLDATRDHGAEVVFCDDALARQLMVEEVAAARGMTAIDTWEEYWITAGHATLGFEMLRRPARRRTSAGPGLIRRRCRRPSQQR